MAFVLGIDHHGQRNPKKSIARFQRFGGPKNRWGKGGFHLEAPRRSDLLCRNFLIFFLAYELIPHMNRILKGPGGVVISPI